MRDAAQREPSPPFASDRQPPRRTNNQQSLIFFLTRETKTGHYADIVPVCFIMRRRGVSKENKALCGRDDLQRKVQETNTDAIPQRTKLQSDNVARRRDHGKAFFPCSLFNCTANFYIKYTTTNSYGGTTERRQEVII